MIKTLIIIVFFGCFLSCSHKDGGISAKLLFNQKDSTLTAVFNNSTENKYFFMPHLQQYFKSDDSLNLQYVCDRINPQKILKESSETEKILNKKVAGIVFKNAPKDMFNMDSILAQQEVITIDPQEKIKIIYKIKVNRNCKKGEKYQYYLFNGISGYRKYGGTQYRSHPHLFEQIKAIQINGYESYNKDFDRCDTINILL